MIAGPDTCKMSKRNPRKKAVRSSYGTIQTHVDACGLNIEGLTPFQMPMLAKEHIETEQRAGSS